ncbi:hypothetical protein [Streptomyces sp. CBMA156]|uniref:hypothetical protein n=1 Tax=Streptomyces sp. CBMA156 TaxID=1930280 RepID=UPI001CB840B2|nr:hypothetical protein [Streptomyces sp. CBMA156]MBD0670160.1 hypothetical protein [Streptomyces sp. CBMA156]
MTATGLTTTTTGTGADRTATPEELLDAGAVLPAGTLPDAGRPDSAADVLTARGYTHPALDGRRIVRLVPGSLGPAEDLALDFLGLVPETAPAEVGQVRQEALGFPAWALVHDPANGHHALALVKEMERLARQATSKPGAAKDGFDELATRLGRAVPHFLPTFCEEVGRIFLGHGNQTYAAAWFGKARDAERTYGLTVDEERLRAVFLEFALAGALTVKSLRQYVKELAQRLDPLTAWQRFRQLCTERSAAGMAPYAGVAEDARALVKAAGLDRTEHERALLAELLDSPAVNRAPGAFWKSWHGALVELGRSDAAVRTRLLELLPDPASPDPAPHDTAWLAVLTETGAEALLTGPRAEGAEPAAAWLQRWCNHHGRGWRNRPSCPDTLALAGRMVERLKADAVPVDLHTGVRASRTRIDLLDLLLTAGVPVADPPDGLGIDLNDWVAECGPDSPALTAVGADERYRPLLRRATPSAWATAAKREVPALPLLNELFAEWAEERAEELFAARGLAAATDLVRAFGQHRTAVRTVAPAVADRVAGLDVTTLLTDALQAGILDELGWPALEEALGKLADPPADDAPQHPVPSLGGAGLSGLVIEDAWPNLLLTRLDRAVVVGPEGIVLEHTLRLPERPSNERNRTRLRFADGELLVVWPQDGKQLAYWSSRPDEQFELEGETLVGYYYRDRDPEPPSLQLPGGGRTTGERPLHAGDTRMPDEHRVLGDGTGYWTVRHASDGEAVLRELDPATGTLGRTAEPPVIAATAQAGRLSRKNTWLLPLQPGLEHTPLGTDGTVLGSWARVEPHKAVTTFTADGQRIVLPLTGHRSDTVPVGRLALPGAAAPVVSHTSGEHFSLNLPDLTGHADRTVDLRPCRAGELSAAGTPLVPPYPHWHALRPRDEAGSEVLRTVTAEQAALLIDAAWPVDTEPVPEDERCWLTVQGVRRPLARRTPRTLPVPEVGAILPGIADRRLLAGVAGIARLAADLLDRIARFTPQPEAERPGKKQDTEWQPEHGRDYELRDAVRAVLPEPGGFGNNWGSSEHCWVLNNLRAVTGVLTAPPAADGEGWSSPATVSLRNGDVSHGWLHLLGRVHALAHAVASPFTDPAHRSSLVLLLGELTKGPLADRGTTLREIVLAEQVPAAVNATSGRPVAQRQGEVLRHGGRTVVILAHQRQYTDGTVHWLAVDHDPSGEFGPVAHFTTVEERGTGELVDAAWVATFWRVAALRGAVPHDRARAEAFSRLTGIGVARSALLLSPPSGLLYWTDVAVPAELDFKTAEFKAARDWLRRHDHDGLAAVWGALLPADPKTLWTEGPDIAAGAEEWIRRFGRLVTLPDEVLATVQGVPIDTVEAVLNPGHTPWLTGRTGFRLGELDGVGLRLVAEDESAVPGSGALSSTIAALRWLAYHLPADSPLRPLLPTAAEALRDRLADPELLLDLDLLRTVKGASLSAVLRTHFGLPAEGGADRDGLVRCGPALVLTPYHEETERVWLRPAALTGPDDPLLELLEGLSNSYWYSTERRAVEAVLRGEPERLAASVPVAPAPDEGPAWLQDPRLSVPALVAEVSRTHGLGEDAATLYLQLLALPDPTDRNAARWTGWKPARLKKARAELAATDLVLEAKRSRAGRGLFLPGGWQEAKSPALPAETWKAALYELHTHRPASVPLSIPELFARAWQRTVDGDAPGYEELRTSKRRKARR